MNIDNCPCCPNHCPKDNLGCGRGKEYYNHQNNGSIEPKTLNEQGNMDLKNVVIYYIQ